MFFKTHFWYTSHRQHLKMLLPICIVLYLFSIGNSAEGQLSDNVECTKENEYWNSCGSQCTTTCQTKNLNKACIAMCIPKCDCIPGYLRDELSNNCVPESECPKDQCTNENEYFNACGSHCTDTCQTKNSNKACIAMCIPKCDCKPGYLRDELTNNCVLKCPNDPPEEILEAKDCPPNSYFNEFGSMCEDKCTEKKREVCAKGLVRGCFCNDGYVKNGTECVPKSECPIYDDEKNEPEKEIICPPNSYFDEFGSACEDTCTKKKGEICVFSLRADCFCNEGYVKNGTDCVPKSDCPIYKDEKKEPPKEKECPPNSYFDQYGSPCEDTCTKKKGPACVLSLKAGCFCNDGYVKNGTDCVPKSDCPIYKDEKVEPPKEEECPPNSYFDQYGSPCEDTCTKKKGPACVLSLKAGCFCNDGYVKNGTDCVPKSDCPIYKDEKVEPPKEEECPPNSYFDQYGSPCEDTCTKKKGPACVFSLKAGCFCNDGYVKNGTECVLKSACPIYKDGQEEPSTEKDCPANSHFEYGAACEDTCTKKKGPICVLSLKAGCFCDDGYVKNGTECVSKSECPLYKDDNIKKDVKIEGKECPENSYWAWGSPCENTCESKAGPVCMALAKTGCYCNEGYVKNGTDCVPKSACPIYDEPETDNEIEEKECPENSYWAWGSPCENTCESKAGPVCMTLAKTGCYCYDGYVKNGTDCVPKSACPIYDEPETEDEIEVKEPEIDDELEIEDCPKNSYWGWGSPCENKCTERAGPVCVAMAVTGCFCNDGYVKNGTDCVPISDCPLYDEPETNEQIYGCTENEKFTDCEYGCERTCTAPFDDLICHEACFPGCVCKEGYVRDKDSQQCVLPEECACLQ